jgi:uncharacterized protein
MLILWQRLDLPGHELASLREVKGGWCLEGTVLVAHDERPCRLTYEVRCGPEWITSRVQLRGEVGHVPVEVDLSRSRHGVWRANGEIVPEVAGCTDVDLSFSPATNLLPIRRLQLAIGERATVRATWVRFPEFTVELLEQVYTRVGLKRYLYESADGTFRRELEVDGEGFIVEYPDFWRAVASDRGIDAVT